MTCHDGGGGLTERAGLHLMGEVADEGAFHFKVDLDRRTAELRMGGGAGIGVGQPAQPGDIAGQFDDALVVDVVQHAGRSPGRPGASALGGWVSPSYIWMQMLEINGTQAPGGKPAPSAR